MGKKGSWFSAVKKVLSHESKEKKKQRQKADKSKKRWFQKQESMDDITFLEQSPLDILTQPPNILDDVDAEQIEVKNEQSDHDHACPVDAQPDVEVVDLPGISSFSRKLNDETAAIKIQTGFRGYMARKALRALKRLVRLKSLMQGQSVKRQVAFTLKSMQTVAHVQSEIRARRTRMSEENQALQRQLQQKREKELVKLKASNGGQWDVSAQSKAQIEAKLANKQEAAMRRERALAYAFSHQTLKNSSKNAIPTFMDPNNPHWGWSWLEGWMAARPWEGRSTVDYQDHVSIKSAGSQALMGGVSKVYARRDLNLLNKPSPMTPTSQKTGQPHSQQSPLTPKALLPSSSGKKKTTSASLRVRSQGGEDESRSTLSVKSDRYQRHHSIAGSSISEDKSHVSLPSVPSYLTPTKAAKVKSRLSSPSVTEKKGALGRSSSSSRTEKKGTMEKGSAGSAKKRLSFTAPSAQPRSRRHSSPPCLDVV